MNRHSSKVTGLAAVLTIMGIVIWVKAGDLNPPPGPVGPTMKTLDQLSAEHAQLGASIAALQGAIASPIKQVIRGVISVPAGTYTQSQTFSPPVNPSKCVVILSDAVIPYLFGADMYPREGAALDSLSASQITVVVNYIPFAAKVSYQIVEYN